MNKTLLALFVGAGALAAAATTVVHVPDYFPAPLGAEWHYNIHPSSGPDIKQRNVVSKVSGKEIVMTSYTPQASTNTYHKVPGWVILTKTDMPASNYVLDYEEDKKEVMNPLSLGKSWSYKGKGGGMDITQEYKVAAKEDVKVPAGTFHTVRVDSTSTMGPTAYVYTYWYADNVGLVKCVSEASGAKTVVELTKYTFPKK